MTSPVRGKTGYRPDIDGLRGLAVLAVVWFHSGLPAPSGLYTGVDIFFVLSGYLVTDQIKRGLDTGTLSLARFYQSRIRRIAPAFVVALCIVLVAGYVLLLPGPLVELGWSALAGLAMIPNIVFWQETPAGYFAVIKRTPPPMLHSWSLGVEEQFYLIWPFILIWSHRLRMVRSAIAVVAVGSFALAVVVASSHPAAAFYLLPMRAWELAAGALLSVGAIVIPQRWRSTASLLGLALLGTGFLLLHGSGSFATPLLILPVLGATLLLGSDPTAPGNRLMTLAPLVWAGKISYSLYLLHWPTFVFLQYLQADGRVSPALTVAAIVAVIGLAALNYFLVEQPARHRAVRFRVVALGFGATAMVVLAGASLVLATAGLPGRFSARELAMAAQRDDRPALALTCLDAPLSEIEHRCRIGAGQPTVLVWGDSHAAAASAGVAAAINQTTALAAAGGCPPIFEVSDVKRPDRCIEHNRAVLKWLKARPNIVTVVLIGRWSAYGLAGGDKTMPGLAATLAALRGRTAVIVAGVPDPRVDVPMVSAVREHLGLAPLRWRCPSAKLAVPGATVVDVSRAFCAYPEQWRLFSDFNHPSLTANHAVIAPEIRRALTRP